MQPIKNNNEQIKRLIRFETQKIVVANALYTLHHWVRIVGIGAFVVALFLFGTQTETDVAQSLFYAMLMYALVDMAIYRLAGFLSKPWFTVGGNKIGAWGIVHRFK